MLTDIARRHPFPDRNGNPLDLARTRAVDQYGNLHGPDFGGLTSIVIISAERGVDTGRCVEAIFRNTREPFEIILSDAGSGEETLAIVKALENAHPNLHGIYNQKSTGTTGQRNQGIHYSRGDHVVFMDNDVLVLPQWLTHLKKTAERDATIGLVGAKLLRTDEELVYYCGVHTITLERDGKVYGIGLDKAGARGNLHRYDPPAMRGGRVPWYTTTTLLARRDALFAAGGFDDMVEGKGIFIANEDKDLSLSVRKAGYTVHYCPEAEAVHNHDYSKVNRNDAYHAKYRLSMEQIERDTLYFLKKWNIAYLIEKLPGEDNSRKWDGRVLAPANLSLDDESFRNDLVTMDTFPPAGP